MVRAKALLIRSIFLRTRSHSSSEMIRNSGASNRSHSASGRFREVFVPRRMMACVLFQITTPRYNSRSNESAHGHLTFGGPTFADCLPSFSRSSLILLWDMRLADLALILFLAITPRRVGRKFQHRFRREV